MSSSLFRGMTHSKAPIVVASLILVIIFLSLFTHRDKIIQDYSQLRKGGVPARKNVFATLLMGPSGGENDTNWDNDYYFMGTRILAYQLLHHPETRSDIPFVVFTSNTTSQAKRERLEKDGAKVVQIEPLHVDWVQAGNPNYAEVLAKLHLWEFTEYDRICLLDGDIVLTRAIDGIFSDPAVAERLTGTKQTTDANRPEEGPLPPTYAFAAARETKPDHEYPPTVENNDYIRADNLNAGFMVLRPDKALFNHYMAILGLGDVGRFSTSLPEQNLLNYAHRWSGNMPWQPIGNTWNVNFPKMRDVDRGVGSVHEKFWHGGEMQPYLQMWRYRMEGFFEAMDEIKKR